MRETAVVSVPLTPDEVAQLMQVSRKTVMRAIERGELEASQLTEKRAGWRIWPDALDPWRRVRSNRTRRTRPAADVQPVGAAAGAADRARRQGTGRLVVTPDMGRTAA